jgi:hypothetical protein
LIRARLDSTGDRFNLVLLESLTKLQFRKCSSYYNQFYNLIRLQIYYTNATISKIKLKFTKKPNLT